MKYKSGGGGKQVWGPLVQVQAWVLPSCVMRRGPHGSESSAASRETEPKAH